MTSAHFDQLNFWWLLFSDDPRKSQFMKKEREEVAGFGEGQTSFLKEILQSVKVSFSINIPMSYILKLQGSFFIKLWLKLWPK